MGLVPGRRSNGSIWVTISTEVVGIDRHKYFISLYIVGIKDRILSQLFQIRKSPEILAASGKYGTGIYQQQRPNQVGISCRNKIGI